jgi:hypothetical protein
VDRELRRARRKRALRRRRLGAALTVSASLVAALLIGCGGPTSAEQAPIRAKPAQRVHRPPTRPPQFVVVSFDGAGGSELWPYWRAVARRAHARFTFFVSGVYLLPRSRSSEYRPPRHVPGSSDIGFAPDTAAVRGMRAQMHAAYAEGHEIGTHFNGHFCAPYDGSVGEWSRVDWGRELDEFFELLRAGENGLPFGADEVVGGRTPCLEGNFGALYPLLARRGLRYDASQTALLGTWPWRQRGLWSMPLLEMPFIGHTYNVVSMDYNFLANQTGVPAASIERETFLTLRHAFLTGYYGNRAPLSIGLHFETWSSWAYNHAVARLLVGVCGLPEVRCVSYRELVDWLDAQPRRVLRRARRGRFERLKRP